MLIDYYLASIFGRVWLRLHSSLSNRIGDGPELCMAVARGERVSAWKIGRAQQFAARVWWRTGMVAVLLTFPVIGISAALRPGRIGTDVAASLIFGLGCVAGCSVAQMGLLSYRASATGRYIAERGTEAGNQPLTPSDAGWPTRFDFWVMLSIALLAFALLLYAGTRSSHGG